MLTIRMIEGAEGIGDTPQPPRCCGINPLGNYYTRIELSHFAKDSSMTD